MKYIILRKQIVFYNFPPPGGVSVRSIFLRDDHVSHWTDGIREEEKSKREEEKSFFFTLNRIIIGYYTITWS